MSDDKGKISADISQAAVDAALAAVEKRQREGSGAEANRVSELERRTSSSSSASSSRRRAARRPWAS